MTETTLKEAKDRFRRAGELRDGERKALAIVARREVARRLPSAWSAVGELEEAVEVFNNGNLRNSIEDIRDRLRRIGNIVGADMEGQVDDRNGLDKRRGGVE